MRLRAQSHGPADVDEIIGDDAQAHPTLDSVIAFVPAAVERVPALQNTNPPFASRSPFLAVAEPPLLLFPLTFRALGGAVGYADSLDTFFLRPCYILGRVKSGIGGHQTGSSAQLLFVDFDSGNQQRPVI